LSTYIVQEGLVEAGLILLGRGEDPKAVLGEALGELLLAEAIDLGLRPGLLSAVRFRRQTDRSRRSRCDGGVAAR
jgi:hypothetical protein